MEHAVEHVMHAHQAGYLVWIPLLPLLGFLANGMGWMLFRDKWPRMLVNLIACLTVAASFVISVIAFNHLRHNQDQYLVQEVFAWLQAGSVDVGFNIVFDRLSSVMCLVVTGVGGLIHLYSTGYMGHDKAFARYFAYLNLFTFAMLLLVMGSNILVMFIGWEGVGLCSYLLIGFWYEDDAKASAGKKAFIVNRIGDFGFLIAIFTIFWFMGTFDFYEMGEWVTSHADKLTGTTIIGLSAATFIGLALFVGATGKSAQIPLFVWLPDAMAGPTPVSALIHAATMVTAGVYMIGRLNFIYVLSPTALAVVAAVGVATALFSATIGFTQNDIKKVLAYSTVSQLGFMFTAMGVGAFAAGIFHLTTHAFFKALLFLGAGSVIHGMHEEQDMRKMGGLWNKMPITFATMAAAWLAISGFPGLSGFISKDEILWKAFSTNVHSEAFSQTVYLVGLLAAVCTAIYMTRLIMMTFLTPKRMDAHTEEKVHESPWTMTVPLIVLALLSVFGGALNWPTILGGSFTFEHWLEPMWSNLPQAREGHPSHAVEWLLMGLSVGLALSAGVIVIYLYRRHMEKTKKIAEAMGPLYTASYNKYYVDEIYDATVIEPTKGISYFLLFRFIDVNIVDGIANGIASWTKRFARWGRLLQTGEVSTYALWIVLGTLAILTFYFGLG